MALTLCSALSGSLPQPSNGSPNHQPEPPPPIADVSHTSELMLVVRMVHRSENGIWGWSGGGFVGGCSLLGKRLL